MTNDGVAVRRSLALNMHCIEYVAIDVHDLFGDANQDHEWTAWRNLRLPPILSRLERAGRFAGWRTFGMRGGFFYRLGGGEKGDGDGEDRKEFHE